MYYDLIYVSRRTCPLFFRPSRTVNDVFPSENSGLYCTIDFFIANVNTVCTFKLSSVEDCKNRGITSVPINLPLIAPNQDNLQM